MRNLLVAGFAACMGLCFMDSPVRAEPLKLEIVPPPAIDKGDVDRVWAYVKKEVGAPEDFPLPPFVLDWSIPRGAKMAFVAPTKEYPGERLKIGITPSTVTSEKYDMLLWGIGHELTHYVFLLRDNDFNLARAYFYVADRSDHCDLEFKRITRGVADVIWNIYHDETERSNMFAEVERACRQTPKDQ